MHISRPMRKSIIAFILFTLLLPGSSAQDTLTMLFLGDIMCHDAQLAAAYDSINGSYDFSEVFQEVVPLFRTADVVVGNLETTLAGPPYRGYPRFSSPDELAGACRRSGITHLMTANNHCCDRGKEGIVRTLAVLDLLDLGHTGTFASPEAQEEKNLLILHDKGFRVGILNYTYGTNGLPVPPPARVNLIDTAQMVRDIREASRQHPDKLILFLHWGRQYQQHPDAGQERLARYLLDQGADIIIGSHPHVLQRMEYRPGEDGKKEELVVYSLGNFISNQRTRGRDGGAVVRIVLVKEAGGTHIVRTGYHLTWVRKYREEGHWHFRILNCREYEEKGYAGLDRFSADKMHTFIEDARHLLEKENLNMPELLP